MDKLHTDGEGIALAVDCHGSVEGKQAKRNASVGPNFAARSVPYFVFAGLSTPDTLYVLEFFANTSANPSGYGEGQIFLGTRLVLTDDLGNAEFTFVFDVPAGTISAISATAANPYGNTSQFSAWVGVG
jgi:hypothetical protein